MKNKLLLLKYLKFSDILSCFSELKELSKPIDEKKRIRLIKEVKDCVIDSVGELALNLLNGYIPFNKNKLFKYQKVLHKIADKKLPVGKRRKILVQSGGFLPLLIEPGLALITGIIGEIIGRKLLK